MKIAVTGGAGFIASHIVDAYIYLGHDVVVMDDFSSGRKNFINKKAKTYEVDIKDKKKVLEIFAEERPEILNHHAAQISVKISTEDPSTDAKINIIGLLNLLEAGRKYGLIKIIFASSGGAIYGDANSIPTDESYSPLLPLSPYGITKLTSEHYLRFYYNTYKIPYIAFRYSNVYGPRQNPHGEAGVVAIFSNQLLKGDRPTINGNGNQTRDYVYVSDVVKANVLGLTAETVGEFNIGTGIETSVNEIFGKLKKVIGSKSEALYGIDRKGEQQRSALNFEKANNVLGWKPVISLEKGLNETVAFFKTL